MGHHRLCEAFPPPRVRSLFLAPEAATLLSPAVLIFLFILVPLDPKSNQSVDQIRIIDP
jgi:hypothetical protein